MRAIVDRPHARLLRRLFALLAYLLTPAALHHPPPPQPSPQQRLRLGVLDVPLDNRSIAHDGKYQQSQQQQ